MKKRLIGGLLIALITVPCFLLGGIFFDVLVCAVGTLALLELINADKDLKKIPLLIKLIACVLSLLITLSNVNESLYLGVDYNLVAATLLIMGVLAIIFHDNKFSAEQSFKLSFITIFTGLISNFYINIFSENKWFLVYLIAIAVGTDVFAYVVGKMIGKHKITKISPNKTIEGCVAGTIAGTAAGYLFFINMFTPQNGIVLLGITLLLSVIGQLGDLYFSLIKRDNNIKDFSNTIPGHGGICDRIDSLSFIVIAFVILLKFV